MSSRSSKHHYKSSSSSGSSKADKSSSRSKKSDDWSDVTEPEERRRIQNRIAQRKFREKAREQRERTQRDAQNQQFAGSSYHTPDADEIADGDHLSGLPWGGISMRHVVSRGHSASQHGSRRESGTRPEDTQLYVNAYSSTYPQVSPASWDGNRDGSSGDGYYDPNSPYYWGPVGEEGGY